MHILLIPSWYSSSRNPVLGSFFKEQAKALQANGYKVTIAYNEIWPITSLGKAAGERGISFEVEDGINTYRYRDYNFLPKNKYMFYIFNSRMNKLYKEIVKKEGKPEIIHAHSAMWGGISAEYLSSLYNIPMILTEHSYPSKSLYLKKSYIPYIKKAYDNAAQIIVVSEKLKAELTNYTDNSNFIKIPNLVDLNRFNIDDNSNTDKKFRYFSLAFLEKGKGMQTLLRAFCKAFKNANVDLIVGGNGSERNELIQLSKSLGIDSQVQFLGSLDRENAALEMKRCNAFVLASEFETFGVVYLEALASGKPIIGTKNGGAEEIINDINGLLVDVGDIDGLSSAMTKLVNNISYYNSNLIRKDCESRFSEKVIIKELSDVYEVTNEQNN